MERKKRLFNLLQLKIHLGIQIILVVCFFALGYFIYLTQLDLLKNDIQRQGLQQAEMVAEASVSSIQRKSYYVLEELAAKAEYSSLVAYCQITDSLGKSFLQNEVQPGLTRDDLAGAYGPNEVVVVTKEVFFDGNIVGYVKLGMFVDQAQRKAQQTTIQLIAGFAAVLGLIAIFLYVYLNHLLILPVVNLSILTESLSKGEFVTTNLDRRKDEIGVLAHGFNNMSRNLKELYKTLEKKVEARTEDLNNAYNELQAIFDNSLVGIAVLSSDHHVIRANSRFAAIFGYDMEEIPQIPPEKFHVSTRDFDLFIEKFYSRLHEAEIAQLEFQFRKKDGAVFWSQVSAKAIDPLDLDKGVIFVLEDISDRKKASEMLRQHAEDLRVAKEEADKATRSKSEFLARMSHEIRTPMNAILGMAEMLQESELSPNQQEYVETFSSAGELLLGIINDILDFSKIEVGQIKLESIPFVLRDLVEDVTKLFIYRAEEKGLILEQSVAPGLLTRYIGDPTRLRQIIINLVGNAIKFTNYGKVSLSVTEDVLDDGSPCCLFKVADTGVGIPRVKLATIFESFAQADSSTTREFGGTGLGLAISKKLVELMGGDLWVESEINEGTVFYFKLPLVPDFQTPKIESRAHLQPDTKILIIEGNSALPESMSNQVRSWGIAPVVKDSAAIAIDVLANTTDNPFDIILIEAMVDGEAAIDIAQLLIGQGLDLAPMVLVVNSTQELADLPEAQDFGPVTYILRQELQGQLQVQIAEILSTVQRRHLADFAGKAWKILLVDDVEANRRVVELFLRDSNVQIIHAENGKVALDKFTEELFDLVLMDMEMPVMDGLEATRRIRLWEQEKREFKTPIIALTAHAFQEHRHKTMDAGCTEFLAKPVKKQALLNIIDLFAGQRESFDQPVVTSPVEKTEPEHIDSPIRIDPELEDLRPLFLRTVRDFQVQIAEAILAKDFVTIQRCGHSLKGLGSTYVVDEISQAGRIIEAAARARQLAVITEAANHLAIFMDTGKSPKIQTAGEFLAEAVETGMTPDSSGRFVVHVSSEMTELIPFLMDAMQKDLELMHKALEQKDFPTIRRFGHSHKGFGSTYGFQFISVVGKKVQIAADAQDVEQVSELLRKLGEYLERVDIVYDGPDLVEQEIVEPLSVDTQTQEAEAPGKSFVVEVDAELFELVPLFLDTMKTNVTEMRQALVDKNYDVICRHGHSQKGLGSTYGFDYLGHLGFQIESAGRHKHDTELGALLDEMEDYMNKVQVTKQEG